MVQSLEWVVHARANNYNSSYGEFFDIEDVLQTARGIISGKAKEKIDVSGLLARYFVFEQRVRDYYLLKIKVHNKELPF